MSKQACAARGALSKLSSNFVSKPTLVLSQAPTSRVANCTFVILEMNECDSEELSEKDRKYFERKSGTVGGSNIN